MSANQKKQDGIGVEKGEDSTINNSFAKSRKPDRLIGRPKDVLCGRGLHILNHHGNHQLHILVNKHKQVYQQARRNEKARIIRNIIKETKRTGARFLKRIEGARDDGWEEVDDKRAYEKVSHALRLRRQNESNWADKTVGDPPSTANQDTPGTQNTQQSHGPRRAPPPRVELPHLSGTTASPIGLPKTQHRSLPVVASSSATASPMYPRAAFGQANVEWMLYDQLLRQQLMLSILPHPSRIGWPSGLNALGNIYPNHHQASAADALKRSSQAANEGDR